MRVLVLGGYGLIGSAVVDALCASNVDVVALGRHVGRARRQVPHAQWLARDLAEMTTPLSWIQLLREVKVDAIVNCAGVLQDGLRDDVVRVQSAAMQALFNAALKSGVRRVVQISAPRATTAAETVFMRSKGQADAALMESALDWVILRPGLVLSLQAYGGSALLRALAAFPIVVPIAYADKRLQTVSVDDVAGAVCQALDGRLPGHRVYDLVEDRPHTLRDLILLMRARYGLPPAPVLPVPAMLARGVSRVADGLGWLGWRSPLRTTAMTEVSAGVTGDPVPWKQAGGFALKSLPETLRTLPCTVQDQWFARLYFLKSVVIGTLALFWFVTGCIALADVPRAMATLLDHGMSGAAATAIVLIGALVDVILGLAILVRPMAKGAALGMITTTLAYLGGATFFAADLWADPLGPLVKAVPAMVLSIVAIGLLEDR